MTLQDSDPLKKPTHIKGNETEEEMLKATYVIRFLHRVSSCAQKRDICNTKAPRKGKVLNIFTAVCPQGLGFALESVSESYFNGKLLPNLKCIVIPSGRIH